MTAEKVVLMQLVWFLLDFMFRNDFLLILHYWFLILQLDATGRPDESLTLEVVGPLQPNEDNLQNGKMCSFSLQKGQLRANACFRPLHTANLEVLLISSVLYKTMELVLKIDCCLHRLIS